MAEVERSGPPARATRSAATAASTRPPPRVCPRWSSSIATDSTVAVGSALPWPAMSGAEPWTGSNMLGLVRLTSRLPLAARPMPPAIAAPMSVMMSPKRLSVTTTSKRPGSVTKNIDAASTWEYATVTSGNSAATSSTIRCHRPPACTRTLVLWTRVRCLRGRALRAPEGVPDDALDAVRGVEALLGGDLVRRALAQRSTGADVRALGALAHHDHVDGRRRARRHRAGDARVQPHRAQVDVVVELEAQLEQQPTLEHAGRDAGVAHGAEQDGVVPAQLVEHAVRAAPRRWRGSAARRGRSRWARP